MPDTTHIEVNFRPETVNEMLLLERIRELRIELLGKPGGFNPFLPKNDRDFEVSMPAPLTLHLMADVDSTWDQERLVIRGRSRGKRDGQLGFSRYVSEHQLHYMPRTAVAHMLGDMHQQLTRELVKALA